jgi:unsaturated rhamnogalacturonyl hydrolase
LQAKQKSTKEQTINYMKNISIFILFFAVSMAGFAQQIQDNQVLTQARRVNDYFMKKYPDPTLPTNVGKIRPSNLWTRAVYYEGLMALYDIDKQKRYIEYTDKWADFHKWMPRNGVKSTNADDQCCGQTYINRYSLSGDTNMIAAIKANIDNQIASNKTNYWTWIDAIQMAMPIYAQFYKITGESKYIEHAMKMYVWTRDSCGGGLFNKAEGLWWRDADFVPPYKEKDGNNCYWSRGTGWVYAALVRVMTCLSPNDTYYPLLKNDFIRMTKAIVKCQRSDGLWNVSLVSPTTFGGKEVSGSSLFLYGLSWGIRNGYLNRKKYEKVCDKAWEGISGTIHENGFLGYVQGTGKEPASSQPVTYEKVPDFEDFGTGCFLLGASEYYKLRQSR